MIYRVQYILLGCLKHSLPCSIQQTTSQGCDNTWFLRIICTLYSHHLHHHRCKKWGGIGGTFLVSSLVFFGRGFSKQGNAVHKIRCILFIKSCKVFKLFFAQVKDHLYKEGRHLSHYLDPKLSEHNLKLGICKKKVKIQLTLWWCI